MTLPALLVCSLMAAIPVDLSLVDGTRLKGELETLTDTSLELQVEGEPRSIPRLDVLQMEFGTDGANATPGATGSAGAVPPEHAEVRLSDGSRLFGTKLAVSAGEVRFDSPALGPVKTPVAAIQNVRFGDLTGLGTAWDDVRGTDSQKDRLIVRKGDALDFVAGAIGEIADGQVSIVIGGQEAKVPTSRVFGLIYGSRKPLPSPPPVCELQTIGGEQLAATKVTLTGSEFAVTTGSGITATIPAERIRLADYGRGKIKRLSDIPRQVAYEKLNPFWSDDDQARIQGLRVDQVPWGRTRLSTLRVGGKSYTNGLWIHSGTTVRFPLDRQYRKLQGLAGLDENPTGRNRIQPKVRLILTLDGQPALDQVLVWNQPPLPLDLDISNARLLELQVQSAGEADLYGACEHLDLVDVKLVK